MQQGSHVVTLLSPSFRRRSSRIQCPVGSALTFSHHILLVPCSLPPSPRFNRRRPPPSPPTAQHSKMAAFSLALRAAAVVGALLAALLALPFLARLPPRDCALLRSDTAAWAASGAYANRDGLALFFHAEPATSSGCGAGGRALALLHGFPTSSFDFAEAMAELKAAAGDAGATCVVAMDFVGFGLSDKPAPVSFHYSIAAQADALLWLLRQHLRLELAAVVAHDYGSTVAQELLARVTQAPRAAGAPAIPFVLLNAGLLPEAHRPRAVQWLLHRFPLLGSLISRPLFQRSVAGVFGPTTQPSQGGRRGGEEGGVWWVSLWAWLWARPSVLCGERAVCPLTPWFSNRQNGSTQHGP